MPGVLACPICVMSVPVLSTLPGLPLPFHPSLCHPHCPAWEMLPRAGHRRQAHHSSCRTDTALTHSPRQGKSLRTFSSTKPTSKPTGNILYSMKALIPQRQKPNAEHLGGEPSEWGSDAVRAQGEFGQCPQHRGGSLALLFRARSGTQ